MCIKNQKCIPLSFCFVCVSSGGPASRSPFRRQSFFFTRYYVIKDRLEKSNKCFECLGKDYYLDISTKIIEAGDGILISDKNGLIIKCIRFLLNISRNFLLDKRNSHPKLFFSRQKPSVSMNCHNPSTISNVCRLFACVWNNNRKRNARLAIYLNIYGFYTNLYTRSCLCATSSMHLR